MSLSGARTLPLGQSGGSAKLKTVPAAKGAFRIEVVVFEGMDCAEFLETLCPSEAEYGTFASSKGTVRNFGSTVQPMTSFLSISVADDIHPAP